MENLLLLDALRQQEFLGKNDLWNLFGNLQQLLDMHKLFFGSISQAIEQVHTLHSIPLDPPVSNIATRDGEAHVQPCLPMCQLPLQHLSDWFCLPLLLFLCF